MRRVDRRKIALAFWIVVVVLGVAVLIVAGIGADQNWNKPL
jgi:hypothetical protein